MTIEAPVDAVPSHSVGLHRRRSAAAAAGSPITHLTRLAALPVFMCGFRPFFLATAVYGALLVLVWLVFLGTGGALPAVAGGALVWHAHELMFGFGLAALAGFVLTAVPEFTATPPFGRGVALLCVLLWGAARVAFWLSPLAGDVAGPVLAALFETGFALVLLGLVVPRLWRDPERRQLGFLWGLAAMVAMVAGFHFDVVRGLYPMRWLLAAVGVMMTLIVVAMSRISMRIVNDALDVERTRRAAGSAGRDADEDLPAYRARPPRRNLAIFAIALYTVAEFALPQSAIAGWVALAAAAAVLNLLNDWHVGRALLTRWAFMLYAVYWLLALGYGLIGVARLGLPIAASAGLHLLTVGAMGLSVFAVLCIAGRTHAGYPLDLRPWVGVAGMLIGGAALLRAAAGFPGVPAPALQLASGLAWVLAYGLAAFRLGVLFIRARVDGGEGCEEMRVQPPAVHAPAPGPLPPG
ncbi:NnrS family protein [Thauera aromatica]|uniref:NnrS family protein n=1 Tax=Thauera aromatica K172 TaxID=44139 RepID=A0A2R4BML3_THAAR|nr:NnrS family protein [Thauera aromatica]AVR88559.1 NnrS family protein [Thauera aromatica K172]